MKILMIDTSANGGIAHYTYNLCEAVAERGEEVRLLAHRDYELSGFPRTFSLHQRFCREEPYWKTLGFILREVLTFRPEIVHFQTLVSSRKDWLLVSLLKMTGVRIIVTAHNLLPHETRRFEETTYRWLYALASKIIVHAPQNREDFLHRFGPLGSKVEVIPHGSYAFFRSKNTLSREGARRKFGIPGGAGMILFFGAIRPYKGLHKLIRSVADLIRAGHDVYLLIAGKVLVGTEEEYRKAIREEGIEDRVLFRQDYVPFNEVADYFAAADMAALPYEHIYDSGILHIAFALGVPVVATSTGSFVDYVRHRETGLLVPKQGGEDLTRALRTLLEDTSLRLRLAENARALDQEHFQWDRIAEKTSFLYASLLVRGVKEQPVTGTRPMRPLREQAPLGTEKRRTVLFVEHTAQMIGGGQQSLLMLLRGIDPKHYRPLVVLPGEGPLADKIRALGIPVFFVGLASFRRLNPIRIFRNIRRLARILREQEVDIVHTNASRSTFYAGLAARMTGVPLIWHVRMAQRERLYDRFLFFLASRVIVISRAVGGRFPGRHAARKICLVYNGIDAETFAAGQGQQLRRRLGLGGKIVVGQVGQIEPMKGVACLIEALEKVRKTNPEVYGLIVGVPTAHQGELEKQIQELGLEGFVSFAGYSEDVSEVMSSIDILALPSSREAFGRVLIEAMACSRPVVAFNVDAVPEVVEDGVTGILVPPGDVEGLARSIRTLADDPALREEMGCKGRERVRRYFGLEEHVRRVELVYEEVLAS